jgi:hypothetical protein
MRTLRLIERRVDANERPYMAIVVSAFCDTCPAAHLYEYVGRPPDDAVQAAGWTLTSTGVAHCTACSLENPLRLPNRRRAADSRSSISHRRHPQPVRLQQTSP